MQRYINNNHQQKAKGKIHPPKYVTKTKPITRLPVITEKVTVQWHLVWDDVTFHPGYYAGTPRLERM